jgi:vacuolar-type H+-ATPase subunit E/Vma4
VGGIGTVNVSLEPLRASLLAQARAEAAALLDAAGREAGQRRAAARTDAESLLRRAAAEREAAAAAARARSRLRARRDARAIVLRARREAYEELRAAAQTAAAGLCAQPGYPRLRERLAAAAREQLGPDAEVTEPAGGGVLARAGERLVDCSLPTLVERCLAGLGPDLEELWR